MIEQFVSDLLDKAQRRAVIVRAPVLQGKIAAVRLPPLPEGYCFYAAGQLPACKTIEVLTYALPLFAIGEIDYKNQAVGILVGDDPVVLAALKKEITVVVEPNTEPCIGAAHELSAYPVIAQEVYSSGDSESCLMHASSVIRSSFKHASQYSPRSEPFSAVTIFREDGLDVYVPTQWPFHVRTTVARVTGLAEEAVVVHPTNTAETFNELLWYPSLLACQCAATAVIERKSISLCVSAEEGCEAAPKTPEVVIEHTSVVSADDEITALHISIIVNAGAYCPLIGAMLKHMALCALGPYNIRNYRIEARAVKTAEGLVDIFEGWGDYYTSNALENHINKIIHEHNLSPLQWRMNLITAEQSALFSSLFQLLAKKSDFSRKYAAYRVFNRGERDKHDGQWRGIGIAGGFQYSGCPEDFTYTAELTLDVHNQLIIKAEPAEKSIREIIKILAEEKLKIDDADSIFEGLTTKDMNVSGPVTANAAMSVVLPLIEQAVTDLQEQRFRNPLPINISRTVCTSQLRMQNTHNKQYLPFIAKMPMACIIELGMDTVCYEIHIRNIWFACACGKVYGKNYILSLLRKNIVAALSRTAQGSLVCSIPCAASHPYVAYQPIPAKDIPPLSVTILEQEDATDTAFNTAAASAFDSCAFNILPAAYLAALNQILLRIPTRIEALPIRTEHIFKAATGED